jgi:hypothetical protein
MANDTGIKSLSMAKSKWANAQPGEAPGAGPQVSEGADSSLMDSFHDRTYNPVNGAPTGNVSGALNTDSARYKRGPGPL